MIKISSPKPRRERESTIALINIVFLMLIFFLIAGTVTPSFDKEISFIKAEEIMPTELSDVLSIRRDGQLYYHGNPITVDSYVENLLKEDKENIEIMRVLADRDLDAAVLIDVVSQLKQKGVRYIRIITERNG